MKRIKLVLILESLTLCAASLLAQTSPAGKVERGLRPHPQDQMHLVAGSAGISQRPEIRVFYIKNAQYWATISEAPLLSSPNWTPAKPLPLDFAKAEAIARQELRKLIGDDATWEVTGFELRSVRLSVPDIDNLRAPLSRVPKWYLLVEMEPPSGQQSLKAGQRSDSFCVFIDFSGQTGTIHTRREP